MRRTVSRPDRAPRIYAVVPGGIAGPGGMCAMAAYIARDWAARGLRPGLTVIDSAGRHGKWRMPWVFALACLRVLCDGLRGRIALLHLHMAERGSVLRKFVLLHLGHRLGIPVVLHLHGAEFAAWHEALPAWLQARVRGLLRAADLLIVLGETSRRLLTERLGVPPGKITVLPNGVPAAPQMPPADAAGPCRLLFLGLVGARKGMSELLQALASPGMTAHPWHLDIAGDGALDTYRQMAATLGLAERTTFHGWTDAAQVSRMLAAADLLVLPSHDEGLPVAILEAMAHGLPVVATPVGAVAEAVRHRQTGLLVPPGDPAALAAALQELVADPALRARLGAAGRQRHAAEFALGSYNDRLHALLTGLLKPARPVGRAVDRAGQVAVLGSGAAIGQALAVLAAPLLTRRYDVAAFGVFGVFGAITSAIGAVATLKYEQAIVIEADEDVAADLLLLCLLLAVAAALLSAAGFAAAGQHGTLLACGPAAILVIGVFNGLNFWFTRRRRFYPLAAYQVSRTAFAVALQLAASTLGRGGSLLVGAQLLGQSLAAALLAGADLRRLLAALGRAFRRHRVAAAARQYRRFPLYGAPQTLGHLLSTNLPLLLLPLLFGPVQTGLFWLAYRMLILPSQILVESVRSVFFRRAADLHAGGQSLNDALARTSARLGLLCAPVVLLLLPAGPSLFAAAFGAQWRQAGTYAAILSLSWWLETIAMPSAVASAVRQLQRPYLGIELCSLSGRAAGLLAGYLLGSATIAIALYALAGGLSSIALMALVGRKEGQGPCPWTPLGSADPRPHDSDLAFYMHDLSGGGVETMKLQLMRELRARGHRTTLLLHARRGPLQADVEPVVLGGRRTLSDLLPLIRYVRQARPETLVSSLHHNNIVALLARLLTGRKTRLVICQHNALSAERAIPKYRWLPLLYRLLSPLADGIVAVSAGVADDFAAQTGIARHRMTVIHNPVIGADFAARCDAVIAHPWLDDEAAPFFIAVGRLTPQKDPHTLLEAFALIPRPVRLLLIGTGPLLQALQSRAAALGIADRVGFIGFQPNPLPFIRRAAALVLASRYEGLGNVIIEALGCGTPVISTDCPYGPAEILEDGRFGRLVPVGDPGALAAAMNEALRTPWPAAMLRRRATEFSTARAADGYLALFAAIAPPERRIFGFLPSRLTAEAIAQRVLTEAPPGVGLVATANIDHIRLLRTDARFAAAYATANMVTCDGFPVAWYAGLRGCDIAGRVTGRDIVSALMRDPSRLCIHRLFLVLDSAATVRGITAWAAHAGLAPVIAAAVPRHGFENDPAACADLARRIRDHGTTVLLMGVGAPKSEIFVAAQRASLPDCWALCVGQALRIAAGVAIAPPTAVQRMQLEWLWRLAHEPRRLAGRYLRAAVAFPGAVLRDLAPR